MEDIYPPNRFPCTDHIPLKGYFAKFSAVIVENSVQMVNFKTKQDISEAVLDSMQIFDKNKREQLVRDCSVDLLTTPSRDKASSTLETSQPSTSRGTAGVKKGSIADLLGMPANYQISQPSTSRGTAGGKKGSVADLLGMPANYQTSVGGKKGSVADLLGMPANYQTSQPSTSRGTAGAKIGSVADLLGMPANYKTSQPDNTSKESFAPGLLPVPIKYKRSSRHTSSIFVASRPGTSKVTDIGATKGFAADQSKYKKSRPGTSIVSNIDTRKDFAVSIRVYKSPTFAWLKTKVNSYKNFKFTQEIVLLGSNTLADLRDKISCIADAGIYTEIEDVTVEPCAGNAKEKYPSGFIFIDDVFYNDTRHKNHIDYSEVILKWAQERNIGPLKTGILETTCLNDLSPRFGYPYVYQHQADCEHILVFSDAWLLSAKDFVDKNDYPYDREISRHGHKLCGFCQQSNAKFICTESDRLASDMFMCRKCLLQYNYKDGKRIGNFKLYPYFDHISNFISNR